ncbi:ig(immunoglobulin) and lrr(leucine rich repeat) domain [Holotrichia oblita]|uniref:Ig(Immunoglobulin) and lrr(Leucine rich repeat) domain n=1 Tax=Holotrichia oblita TaxID=644536 RepID=A0ACB9TKP2_HOLOL|nr:ig(immunoglobulin) and lrr(leucine rich repeat) domain [Holotrichia oblita]
MWWLLLSLIWWCGTAAVPAPGSEKWKCPEISEQPVVECSCDMPHTLRCTGDRNAMKIIGGVLRSLDTAHVSLLDCTVQNVSSLPGPLLDGVALHGLVISSGEIKEIHNTAFKGLAAPLQALGLPNNQLVTVPIAALKYLPELDRLDLSSNKLKDLNSESFQGLRNLSFIELSDNQVSKIEPNTFTNLPLLKTLRIRSNKITTSTISSLEPLLMLEELDLSGNNLIGPLAPKTFPRMPSIKDLQLAHNAFSSIKMGALENLPTLTTLSLHHNQIDVLEDHAFMNLSNLVSIDLAHNRIVAVSGSSLAHLSNLIELDLRHNFLRALTADLILPLKTLQNLKLDENDISIIASDSLKGTTVLKKLSLADNPLNCDCSLIEFALWLANSTLSKDDQESAVCTTPPSLENALLIDIPTKDLLCGEDEQDISVAPSETPIKARINLENYIFDGEKVFLQWYVEEKAIPYTCDKIFVYEEEGNNEVPLETNPLKCNSSTMLDPRFLNVTVPNVTDLILGHKYRYCVVLLGSGQDTDELSLNLGCSDIIPLIKNVNVLEHKIPQKNPKVIAIQANLTSHGHLAIDVNVYPKNTCELNVAILEQGALLSQKKINCTEPKYTFVGLQEGPYRVCANILQPGPALESGQKPRCVTVFKHEQKGFSSLDVAFVSIFLVLCFMVIALIWGVRKILLKPKVQTHQCFMPPEVENPQQHNRYVKLQATTKL